MNGLNQLHHILQDFPNITKFFVTLDNDNCILSNIPGNIQSNSEEFINLINLEISQHNPNQSISDYRVKTMSIFSNSNPIQLITLISVDILIALDCILANLGHELTDVNSSFLSVLNAYYFNYPQNNDKGVLLIQISNNIIEFYILLDNQFVGYDFRESENEQDIYTILEQHIVNIAVNYEVPNIDSIYFFGPNLTKEQYIEC